MKNNITQFETYGKQNPLIRFKLLIRERLRTSIHTKNLLESRGLKTYTPKLNKWRLIIGLIGVIVIIAIPFITPLAIFPFLWGIK